MYSRKSLGPWALNGALGNSSINRICLWRYPIQSHSKSSITEKRQNKANYLTWNSITPNFVKKTNMPSPEESPRYIKCYSSNRPRAIRSPIHLQLIGKTWNHTNFCRWLTRLLFTSFTKTLLTTERRLTGQ